MTKPKKNITKNVLTIAQANRLAAGRIHVSQDDVDATLWAISGDGFLEAHEPMDRAAWETFLKELATRNVAGGPPRDMLSGRSRRAVERELAAIARKHLAIKTLAKRYKDGPDFYIVTVPHVKEALRAAFELGYRIL